jgi:hypothetical protein
MALERARRIGSFAPLSATYYMDDAIADAGPEAELLFVRGLAYSSLAGKDGFISDMQLVRYASVGLTDPTGLAQLLVDVGLWERVERGYQVRSWLKWNRSAQEMHEYRQGDADRKRGERAATKPAAKTSAKTSARKTADPSDSTSESASETPSERSPNGRPNQRPSGVRTESETQSSTEQSSTEQQTPPTPPAGGSGSRRKTETPAPGFDAFWQAYPAKVDKGHAVLAWNKALKAGADPATITTAAQRFRDSPSRKVDFTPHPATWLNGERWLDQPTEPARAGNARTPFWEN